MDALYSCDLCGKSFTEKHILTRHVFTHIGERAFGCENEGHTVIKKKKRTQHLVILSDHKRFSCGVCGKSFSAKCNLKYHMYVHSGDKPYEPRQEKTGFLHMRTQRRRSALR